MLSAFPTTAGAVTSVTSIQQPFDGVDGFITTVSEDPTLVVPTLACAMNLNSLQSYVISETGTVIFISLSSVSVGIGISVSTVIM